MVTIIITSFNYGKYVARAIRSCLDQSYPRDRFEILVVDDASTDNSRIILESFGKYIRTIFLDKNVGLAAARNIGIQAAKGEYVVFLDADDFLHNDFLRVCMLHIIFNWKEQDAVATDYFLVDDTEEHLKRENVAEKPLACGVVYSKEHLLDIGLYDSDIHIGEDVDFRIRFLKKYRIGRVDLPLYRYRMHNCNRTSNGQKNEESLEVVRKKHGMATIASPYVRNELINFD